MNIREQFDEKCAYKKECAHNEFSRAINVKNSLAIKIPARDWEESIRERRCQVVKRVLSC